MKNDLEKLRKQLEERNQRVIEVYKQSLKQLMESLKDIEGIEREQLENVLKEITNKALTDFRGEFSVKTLEFLKRLDRKLEPLQDLCNYSLKVLAGTFLLIGCVLGGAIGYWFGKSLSDPEEIFQTYTIDGRECFLTRNGATIYQMINGTWTLLQNVVPLCMPPEAMQKRGE